MNWKLRAPDDLHVHLRQGEEALKFAQDARSAGWKRVLAMPNTLPPLTTIERIREYQEAIHSVVPDLDLIIPFKIHENMDEMAIKNLREGGVIAGKYYPAGATTNSEDGISNYKSLFPVFEMMEAQDMVLCIHGEDPSVFSLDREAAFIPRLEEIHTSFPKLRIVLEHVSSKSGIEAVMDMGENVRGTITIHHLLFTLDDVIGGNLQPHFFCKPVLKSPQDRRAIQSAALSSQGKFFFGSDSAPHLQANKERENGSPGIYSMPVTLPLLAEFFSNHGKQEALEPFVSQYGAEFYQIPLNQGEIELIQESWTVPESYHGVRPLLAGHTLQWKVK